MPRDFAYTYARMKVLPVDIFLGPHGWIFGLKEKLEQMKQDPAINPFLDPDGYINYILGEEKLYLEALKSGLGSGTQR
jgi:hypothetical protein